MSRRRVPRDRLLDAAREAFVRRGYADVNVDDICRAARIAKGSFYRHYRSKEAVFFTGPAPLRGKERVAAAWRRFYDQPEAPFSWEPSEVVVLESGALAMSSGPVRDPRGKRVATFALDGEVRFASAADRSAFAEELSHAVAALVAKYHDEAATGGRAHRIVVAIHPSVPRNSAPDIAAPETPELTEES